MQIGVQSDLKELTKKLTNIQRRQIPFAVSQSINNTLFDAMAETKKQLTMVLDRPTPFTIKGMIVVKSKKGNLEGSVGFKPKQAEYMRYQIEGGTRHPKGRSIPIATNNIKLNKYGNLSKNKISTFLADKKRYFSGVPNGKNFTDADAGIWKRMGTTGKSKGKAKIRKEISYHPVANYKPRFPFKKIVAGVVKRNFPGHFSRNLDNALRTAK
jgi:hypothetical protein